MHWGLRSPLPTEMAWNGENDITKLMFPIRVTSQYPAIISSVCRQCQICNRRLHPSGCCQFKALDGVWDNRHDDVIKWKHFPRNWPYVREIQRSPVNSPHKCQWRGALMLSLICVWIHDWVNNREAGDLRRYGAQYEVIVMELFMSCRE